MSEITKSSGSGAMVHKELLMEQTISIFSDASSSTLYPFESLGPWVVVSVQRSFEACELVYEPLPYVLIKSFGKTISYFENCHTISTWWFQTINKIWPYIKRLWLYESF